MRRSPRVTLLCLVSLAALVCGQQRGSGVKIGQGPPRDLSGGGGRGTGVRIGSNTGRGVYSKTTFVTTQVPAPSQIRPPTENGGEAYGNGGGGGIGNGNGNGRHNGNGNGNGNGKSLYSGNDDTTEAGYIVPQVRIDLFVVV